MALIEIDGKKIEAEPGMMIIEAADLNGVWIPRFCYHKKLSIAANCRMCLVDVEKTGKPLPACATPITDGMKIWTKSQKALLAQQSVMEFLLINHPLDCPICDQGGECELQDISMGYGLDHSRYNEGKRTVKDKDLGPLISSDMTRCIQCTRCVRFGTEVDGLRELGAYDRGEHMEIGTFIEHNIESELSGNVIELCPVGALTSKPFRFTARGFELLQRQSIAAHDCMGSNINIHVRRNEVMRVIPKENELVNEIWISDRDRFSYEGLYQERLQSPMIKQEGRFISVSWEKALNYVIEQLKNIKNSVGPSKIGGLISPNATTEEGYLFQKLLRGLGTNNIDHRLKQLDFRSQELSPAFPNLGVSYSELENQSLVLLLGSWLRHEQPTLAIKLRKLTQGSGKVMVINPIDCEFNFEIAQKRIVEGCDLFTAFAKVAKALLNETSHKIPAGALNWLAKIDEPDEQDKAMARALLESDRTLILLGALALHHPQRSSLISLANLISEITQAKVGTLTDGANAAGAWLSGCVPHRQAGGHNLSEPGFHVRDMWKQKLKAFLLLGLEPEFDCAEGEKASLALQQADFVVSLTPYETDELKTISHVLLPTTPFSENSGTYINVSGLWQSFNAAVTPLDEARPAWKILRVLGNLFDFEGFNYNTTEEVLYSLKNEQKRGFELENFDFSCPSEHERSLVKGIVRLTPTPIYGGDNVVRRSKPLQKTHHAQTKNLRLNQKTAENLRVSDCKMVRVEQEGRGISLPLIIDNKVPENTALIPSGGKELFALGAPYNTVVIEAG